MSAYTRFLRKLKRDGLPSTLFATLQFPSSLKRRFRCSNTSTGTSISDRFNKIYEKNIWRSKETVSGGGSELHYTETLREWLINRLPELDVKVFVDAPCGDFNWMSKVLPEVDVDYLGLDIVGPLIQNNIEIYGAEKVKFSAANICEDKLPACDLLMVRDCLFHLSYEDIDKFLKNISDVEYRYLLTTTHVVDDSFANNDIQSGDSRLIDLFAHPFNFDESLLFDRVNDYPKGYEVPREMLLIEKKNVPISLSRAV